MLSPEYGLRKCSWRRCRVETKSDWLKVFNDQEVFNGQALTIPLCGYVWRTTTQGAAFPPVLLEGSLGANIALGCLHRTEQGWCHALQKARWVVSDCFATLRAWCTAFHSDNDKRRCPRVSYRLESVLQTCKGCFTASMCMIRKSQLREGLNINKTRVLRDRFSSVASVAIHKWNTPMACTFSQHRPTSWV